MSRTTNRRPVSAADLPPANPTPPPPAVDGLPTPLAGQAPEPLAHPLDAAVLPQGKPARLTNDDEETDVPTQQLVGVTMDFTANGSRRFTAPYAMTLRVLYTLGTGTVAWAKAAAGSTTFSSTSAPFVLAAGETLRATVTGLTGFYTITLERTA